jgi:hypothetical protein
MSKKKANHIHKYRLVDIGFSKVQSCAVPNCPHFMPAHLSKLLIGRASICWECDNEFNMTEDNLKEEFPRCMNCKNPELAEAGNMLNKIFER